MLYDQEKDGGQTKYLRKVKTSGTDFGVISFQTSYFAIKMLLLKKNDLTKCKHLTQNELS